MDYPYTLKLTAPITVVMKGNGNTGDNVLFGATTDLRTANHARVITLSGANAVADNRPGIASVIPSRAFFRRANGRTKTLLTVTTSIRTGDRRPLTGTVVRHTGASRVTITRIASFDTIMKGNLATVLTNGVVGTKGLTFIDGFMGISSSVHTGTIRFSGRKGAPLFFTTSSELYNVVTITSAVGRSDPRTIERLGGVNVEIIVLANSGRRATGTVKGRTKISRIVTNILPSNGRTIVEGLGGRNEMTVINSKVGSTPTLAHTSVKVTVNTKDSITVSTTSIILVGDHLVSMPTTIQLDHTALAGVRRGLF